MSEQSASPPATLETDRLTVRPLQADDAEFIVAVLTDPDFVRNVGDRGVKNVDDARKYIADRTPGRGEHPSYGVYAVTLKVTGERMGICTLFQRPNLDAPDLGFAFLPAYRSKGYAFEAARALRDYAFTSAGIARLVAIVQASNVASTALLERLGFVAEGTTRGEDGVQLMVYAARRDATIARTESARR